MNIILNSALQKVVPNNPPTIDVRKFAGSINYKLDKLANKEYKFLGSFIDPTETEHLHLGLVGLLSKSYSQHEKLEIGPHDIWYLVLSEIALIIKGNTEACRPLFTNSTEKIDILVPTADPEQIDLSLIIAQLRTLIPVDVDTFIPTLSTETPESKMAMYAALCDGVQAYYSYSTFCCGIPEIRLTGTLDDWTSLLERVTVISALFASVGLERAVEYMFEVGDLIVEIAKSYSMDQSEFWKGIFTSKNIGSGGELEINGWITKLFYEKRKANKIENFMTSMSVVPYKNLDSGREFRGVYGAFQQLRDADDFIKAGYSQLIFEVVDETPKVNQAPSATYYSNDRNEIAKRLAALAQSNNDQFFGKLAAEKAKVHEDDSDFAKQFMAGAPKG